MKIRAFITHKLKEKYSECQDYFDINLQRHAIAVADGMSQSIFPQVWAKELTKAYTSGKNIEENLGILQTNWMNFVEHKIQEKEAERPGSAWRLENNKISRKGAGSTLCGISFHEDRWKSYILGDTSLIIVSPDYKIDRIINSNKSGFSNHPDYFDSFDTFVGEIVEVEGDLKNGWYIILVTDPFGEFLEQKKNLGIESQYIKRLVELKNHEEFTTLVENWRESERMHNDDSTCVIVKGENSNDFEIEFSDSLDALIIKGEQSREDKTNPVVTPTEENSRQQPGNF